MMISRALQQKSIESTQSSSFRLKSILSAISVFLLWTLTTLLFEGRLQLMHHPTPVSRAVYVLIANVVVGIGVTFWGIQSILTADKLNFRQSGFQSRGRTIIGTLVAFLVGGTLFVIQGPPTFNPLVLFNGFAMVLPVSIAEIVVCWTLIGRIVESGIQYKYRVLGVIAGIVAADLCFGLYHFAHSAPFNQTWMVLFLLLPGLVTSLVFFLGRDIYATIVFHNFLGMTGVMKNVNLNAFHQPLYHHYIIMIVSVTVLIVADRWLIRKILTQKSE